MERFLSRHINPSLTVAGAIFGVMNALWLHEPFFGIVVLALYSIPPSIHIGRLLYPSESPYQRGIFGFLILTTLLIILLSSVYYIFDMSPVTASVVTLLPLLIFFKKPINSTTGHQKNLFHFTLPQLLSLLILVLDVSLLILLIQARTIDLSPSPWQQLGPEFFLLYAITTALLFFGTKKLHGAALYLPHSFHLFVTFGVAAIIYTYGFGFDAFIHRATETWIFEHGSISPKQPYYIGQYALVVWLARLTSWPIFFLDVFLVPTLAAIFLPVTVAVTSARIWNFLENKAILFTWIIPVVPFLSLHLTTPYNLALLLLFLTIFLSIHYFESKEYRLLLLLLTLGSVCIHPLIGAPLFVYVVGVFCLTHVSKKQTAIVLPLYTLALTALAPVLFTINNFRVHGPLPIFHNPFARLPLFLELFARPYWYAKHTPLRFEILYGWAYLIVPVAVLLALIGVYFILKEKKYSWLILLTTSTGLCISAWLLRSWVAFADVVSYEQGDYPLRLVKLSFIFLLPFVWVALYRAYQWSKNKTFILPAAILIAAGILTISLYLSYPQRNIKARFPGFNVTESDFRAVTWIHEQHPSYDYVVLSNQLVSSAALTKYSFAKYFSTGFGELFYYSIPTGGPLYQEYGRMLYEGQKREYMEHAMEITGTNTAYFVINTYWANSDKIIAGAKTTADRWHVIDDRVWIFTYTK